MVCVTGQTKWVAEQVVLKAQAMGLPGAIYRLGNVGGPSNGGWNKSDSNLLFIHRCFAEEAIPEADWSLEMTPVNSCETIVASHVVRG